MEASHTDPDVYEDDSDDELNEHWHEPGDPDGIVAKELHNQEQARRASSPDVGDAREKRHKPKRFLKVVLGAAFVMAAAGVVYWIGSDQAATPSKKPVAQTSKSNDKQNAIVPIVHYDSTAYSIGMDYPNSWAVSDTTEKLTVTSPSMKMSTPGGQINGHVIIAVQNQQTALSGFPTAGALASLASDKLTYKQPTSVQRAQTYLSYLGFSSANTINALYLTGDAGYQQGQSIPLADVIKGNPLVSVTFASCSDSVCAKNSTQTPLVLQADSWKNAQFKSAILNILESLTIN